MQVYVEMAKHLAKELAQAREHVAKLEAALEGLKPLLTLDNGQPAAPALSFTASAKPKDVVDVVVETATPTETPAPAKAARRAKAVGKTKKAVRAKRAAKPEAPVDAEAPAESAAKPEKKPRKQKAATVEIPRTSAAFWRETMGRSKLAVSDVVARAIEKMQLPVDAKPVLTNRLNAWLYPALSAGTLKATGTNKQGVKLYQVV